ncbi:MAG: hypothetical protein WAW37_10825 [Syntrophobacteraceae bacterium]
MCMFVVSEFVLGMLVIVLAMPAHMVVQVFPFFSCMDMLMAVDVFVPMAVHMLVLVRVTGPPMRMRVRVFVSVLVLVLVFVCMFVVTFHLLNPPRFFNSFHLG